MLQVVAVSEGVRIRGFLDDPSLVMVTCKSILDSEDHIFVFPDTYGIFNQVLMVKGIYMADVSVVPIMKTDATFYAYRPVENGDELVQWFKAQGLKTMLQKHDLHITIAYSKARINWEAIQEDEQKQLELEPSLRRAVMPLGDKGAVVLKMEHLPRLQARWDYFIQKGASWDYPGYQPHITLTYKSDTDVANLIPYPGRIVLGSETWEEVKDFSPVEKAGCLLVDFKGLGYV